MEEHTTTVNRGGTGILGWTFIVFLVLKLGVGDTAVQDWSWWWVTAPLWGSVALMLVLLLIGGIVVGIASLFESKQAKSRRKARQAINNYSKSFRR